jgi:hypothetical protein
VLDDVEVFMADEGGEERVALLRVARDKLAKGVLSDDEVFCSVTLVCNV